MNDAAVKSILDLDIGRSPAATAVTEGLPSSDRFTGVLFDDPAGRPDEKAFEAPEFFRDLNCDQLVEGITAGKGEYALKPFFYSCLHRIESICYRHGIFRDLEDPALLGSLHTFARQMHEMREHLVRTRKLHYKEQRQAWFLDAVEAYCETVNSLAAALREISLHSRGLLGFGDYLAKYQASRRFHALLSEAKKLKVGLATVQYTFLIKGPSVTVRRYDSEDDYSAEVEDSFTKFKQGSVKEFRVTVSAIDDMNHIEAKILEFVAKLHPEVFVPLDDFCARHSNYLDDTLVAFDREIQFYLAYLEYTAPLKSSGLQFCYPEISVESKNVFYCDGFDIVLANKLVNKRSSIVCNDFHLDGLERILVISGPNQGGKTTFARAFGQLHFLASIGCPVPGRKARLFLFDRMFTHFEREEKVENLRGKLEDDLKRIHAIVEKATSRSILVMNEIFTSTALKDEVYLSTKVVEKLVELDLLCVWVTFIDELASFGPQTVSMVSTVVPEDPALRTFKIVRRPADGLAYAQAIAQKYGLTCASIKERI